MINFIVNFFVSLLFKEEYATEVSEKGVEFIKRWEGLSLCRYKDVAGHWTIGYGHLIRLEDEQWIGECITQDEANGLLRGDLLIPEKTLEKYQLSQHQFDACASLIFNIGVGAFERSTLAMHLRNKNYVTAALEFERWVHVGGKRIKGLVNRRNEEKAMFLGLR